MTVLRMPLKDARVVTRTHRPAAGEMVCPVCTRLGVGSNRRPVPWPCEPYRAAVAALRAAGEPRPAPDGDTAGEPGGEEGS